MPFPRSLLILGCGYVGEHLGRACLREGMRVYAQARRQERAEELSAMGFFPVLAEVERIPDDIWAQADALVDSIPLTYVEKTPTASQCSWVPQLAGRMAHLRWIAYLSSISVYGDAGGAWVDEDFPCRPESSRGRERLAAERCWLGSGLPAEVFRLSGVYGPGRNLIGRLRAGGYQAVKWDPPHFSNRIHVADIVAGLLAAMRRPQPGRLLNLTDDLPLPHVDYVCELAKAAGAPAPILVDPAEAEGKLSRAALEFFRDSKRLSNRRLHADLLPHLRYPSFREALPELLAEV